MKTANNLEMDQGPVEALILVSNFWTEFGRENKGFIDTDHN